MGYNPHMPDPKDVIKIVAVELPDEREIGEGVYEYRTGINPKQPIFFDIIGLEKQLKKVIPDKANDLIDRLQNFRRAYVNLATGEITS